MNRIELTERQARWTKNSCIIAIVLDVCLIADKHPVLGMCIAIPFAILLFYVVFTYNDLLNPESEDDEPCCDCHSCDCSCHNNPREGWDG